MPRTRPETPGQCTLPGVPATPNIPEERAFLEAVLRAEAAAIAGLVERLGEPVHTAVTILTRCADGGGSVLITGLGKSGLIGQKISATLASLGVPSHSIHPTEAVHGDLGRIRPADCLIAISNSGETEEVVALAAILRQDKVPVISISGGEQANALNRLADAPIWLGRVQEATTLFLAPTSSTTATLAIGDALALAVARRRKFTDHDFARHHPGGSLGGLMRRVADVLRFEAGKNLPVIPATATVRSALDDAEKLGRRPGALLIVDEHGVLAGIFTDGDLRRLVLRGPERLNDPIGSVMTRSPRSISADALVRDAVRLVREFRSDEIPVVDAQGKPVGLLDVQDLIALKVVS